MNASSSVVFLLAVNVCNARRERSRIAVGLAFDLDGDFNSMLDPVMKIHSGGAGFFEAAVGESIQSLESGGEDPLLECGSFSWTRHGNVSMVIADALAEDAPLEILRAVAEDVLARSAKWFGIGWGEPVWRSFEAGLSESPGPLGQTVAALAHKPALSLAQEAGTASRPPETAWIEAQVERARIDGAAPKAASLPSRQAPRI